MSKRAFSEYSEPITPRTVAVNITPMPYAKRPRKITRKGHVLSRVPRAIQTRGTPSGYYEIPVTIYRKVYFNMSTGVWPTNQSTGAQIGATGYPGFGFATQLDSSHLFFGSGSISATDSIAVPGFTGQLAACFDTCKIVRIDYTMWYQGQAEVFGGGSAKQAPNLFIAVDPNNVDPPSSLDEVMQYSKVYTVAGDINRPTKFSCYPTIRLDSSGSPDAGGTNESRGVTSPSTYIQTALPGTYHYGLRGWADTLSSAVSPTIGYIHIQERQIRRYKITR